MIQPELFAPQVTYGDVHHRGDSFVIDAEPHVMMRCRPLFKNGRDGGPGQHTHAIQMLPTTPDTAKDILWLIDRYPLQTKPEVRIKLLRLADQYDRSQAAAAVGDTNQLLLVGEGAYELAEPARPYQIGFYNLQRVVKRILLADDIGLGKTISAIAALVDPDARPAIIVVQPHLTKQWAKQVKRFLPQASVDIIRKAPAAYKVKPSAEILIIGYSRLGAWQDYLVPQKRRTIIFDEVQELRHIDTVKRGVSKALTTAAVATIGLSATPIYNMGAEIWSVLDALSPDCLGPLTAFKNEWCVGERVVNAKALHAYLKSRGLMLRRTREDVGMTMEKVTKDVITLDGDLESLAAIKDVVKALAMSVLSDRVGESSGASRELDWRMRQATGVAKARSVGEFVKMLLESGESVFLAGWHRDVYDIWLRQFQNFRPVMYTGTESPAAKQKSIDAFTKGVSKLFICSLRSGAGIDGLQEVCNTAVIGELDWSPHVMDQIIGRLDRDGQTKPVNAYFLTIDDGADPFMIEVLADKRSQSEGIVDGKEGEVEILADTGLTSERIRAMAAGYLESIGETVPLPEPPAGLQSEVVAVLRRLSVPSNTEKEMQASIWSVLPDMLPVGTTVEREYVVGQRNRLDFLVTRGDDRIAVECKIAHTDKGSVYRQVRRYVEEAGVTGVVLFAPWLGVQNFIVDDVPVSIVDWSKARI